MTISTDIYRALRQSRALSPVKRLLISFLKLLEENRRQHLVESLRTRRVSGLEVMGIMPSFDW